MRSSAGWLRLLSLVLMAALLGCQSAPTSAPTAPPKPTEASKPAASPAGSPAASPSPSAASPVVSPSAMSSGAAPTGPRTQVKVGVLGSASDAGLFIALEMGYFAQEGLDVELVSFDSAARMPPAIGTEQIQVGGGALSAGLFNLAARQTPLKIVADKGLMSRGFGYEGLMVRQDLLDSGGVKEVKDLRGRKIAHITEGNGTHFLLDRALRQGGLAESDVELTTMPFPDMVPALANKTVDAAVYLEPNGVRAEEQGIARRILTGDQIFPDHQLAVLFYSAGFAQQQGPARGFALAYVRGVRDYNDAFVKQQGRNAVVEILAKHGTIKDPGMYGRMIPPGLSPDGALNMASIEQEVEWYVERGFIRERPNLAEIVDGSFVGAALERLGPYR